MRDFWRNDQLMGMGTIQLISFAKFLIVGTILLGSSIMDVRYRRIPDRFWILMLIVAGPLTFWEMYLQGGGDDPITFLVLLLPLAGMMFILFGYPEIREVIKGNPVDLIFLLVYISAVVGTVIAFFLGDRELFIQVVISFLFMVLYFILYSVPIGGTRIIHGGADAKCMIALAGLFPWYVLDVPLQIGPFYETLNEISAIGRIFPVSLSVLFNSSVITAVIMFVYLPLKNLMSGEFSLGSFTTYYMNVDDLPGSHVWVVLKNEGKKEKEDPTKKLVERLRSEGVKRIKVSPKIPFILSLTAGFFVQFILGNLVAVLFLLLA
jgi:hypothetical protein